MLRFHRSSVVYQVLALASTLTGLTAYSYGQGASATDPSGTWKWERTFGDNRMDYTLTLTRDKEGKVAGSYAVKRGDTNVDPVKLEDAKLDGNKLTFHVQMTRGDQNFTVHYEGVVKDDQIEGKSKANFGGQEREFEWLAKRVAKESTDEATWKSLFDGKSLDGWERVGNEKSVWVVENGSLTASGPASMLVHTSGPYKNFRYRAEVKISDGGNSGLYFRTTRTPGFTDGYEAQIDSTHTDPIRTGSLYGMCHVYKQHVKPDTWFTYEIEVRDDVWRGRNMTRIKISIDGNELYEYLDFGLTFKEGHFAFQHHDPESTVNIRKVEVLPLPEKP